MTEWTGRPSHQKWSRKLAAYETSPENLQRGRDLDEREEVTRPGLAGVTGDDKQHARTKGDEKGETTPERRGDRVGEREPRQSRGGLLQGAVDQRAIKTRRLRGGLLGTPGWSEARYS